MPDNNTNKAQNLSIRLPEFLATSIELAATEMGISPSAFVRKAITTYLYVKMPHVLPENIRRFYDNHVKK